jgi:hypothetical protein
VEAGIAVVESIDVLVEYAIRTQGVGEEQCGQVRAAAPEE